MSPRYDLDAVKQQMDRDGFAPLREFMSPDLLEALRRRTAEVEAEEGDRAGSEFKQESGAKRLANLVDKGEVFEQMIACPEILEVIEHVLGPEYKLGSLNYRSAYPNEGGLQPLHVDMGLLIDDSGSRVCNTIWLLDDFTPENGATRAVPGSHHWKQRPQAVLEDANAPHPQEVLVTGKAGDVVIMNSHCWHGGTTNHTDKPRRALHCLYVRRDVPQQQYQKKLLREETQARLSPQLRRILALDDPFNDELCASGVQLSGFMK
jgi:ectoine hydroxylase-related dioxygenase (phytanoyl-CoA dioxygenase family)